MHDSWSHQYVGPPGASDATAQNMCCSLKNNANEKHNCAKTNANEKRSSPTWTNMHSIESSSIQYFCHFLHWVLPLRGFDLAKFKLPATQICVWCIFKGKRCHCLWLLFLICPDAGASDSECWRLRVQHVSVNATALPRLHAGSHVRRRPPHRQGRTRKLLHWPWRPAVSVS